MLPYRHRLAEVPDTALYIRREESLKDNKFYYGDVLEEIFTKINTHSHEVIRGDRPQRIAFDIDKTFPDVESAFDFARAVHARFAMQEPAPQSLGDLPMTFIALCFQIKEVVKAILLEYFGNDAAIHLLESEVAWLVSHACRPDKIKLSMHIIVAGTMVANHAEAKAAAVFFNRRLDEWLGLPVKNLIDLSIYKSNYNLRLPYQSKCAEADRGRIMFPMSQEYKIADMIVQPPPEVILPQKIVQAVPAPMPVIVVPVEEIEAAMAAHPDYFVGYAFRNIIGAYVNFNRTGPTLRCICGRVHDVDNAIFIVITDTHLVLKCHREAELPGLVLAARQNVLARAKPARALKIDYPAEDVAAIQTRLDREYHHVELTNRYLDPTIAASPHETIFIASPMGTGKSTIVAAAIRTARTVVMASFRRAFTAEKSQQFGLQSYEDFGFMPRIKCDKLICQVESLHKIDFDYRAPEVLILDEIQSIISQFNSNLAPATNQDSIRAFRELVRCAGRVFVLDAYMTSATIDMIREMRAVGPNGPREAIVYKNVFKPLAGMTTTVYNCKAAIATAIIERAKAGEHIVVCSDTNKWLSQVYEKLRAEGVVDAMLVTGDNSAAFAENVRKNGAVGAASARVFLYNTALLAGVDIAGAPHKKLFAMFTNRYISANHAMQLMGRFRGIESIGIAFDERTVYEMTLDGYLGSIASSDWENLHTTIGGKFAVIKRDLNKVGKLIMQGHVNDHNSRIHFAENVLGTLAYHGARIVAARYTEQTALPPAVIRPNEYRINELFGVNDIKKLPVAVAADVQNPKIQHLQAVFNNIGDDTFDMHNLMNQLEIQRFERDDLAVEPQEIPGGELDVATQRHTFAARINHAKHQILAYRLLRALHVPTDVRVLGYAAPIARDVMEGWVRDIPLEVINQRTYCKFKPLMTNEFNRKLKIINTIIESAFGFRVIYTSRRRIDGQQVCTDYILKMNEKFAYDPTRNKYFLMALIVIPRIVPQEIPPEEPPEQHPDLRPTNDPPG